MDDPSQAPAGPPAQRLRRRRWADPRLAVGALLVAASVVGGAAVINAQDSTVAVWALKSDARAGERPTMSDLRQVKVHLGDDVTSRYLPVDEAIDGRLAHSVWAHDVRSGELLGESALTSSDSSTVGELPLAVAPGSLPADLQTGQRVDVWVSPDSTKAGGGAKAERLLRAAKVLSVQGGASELGGGSAQTVLVALDEQAAAGLRTVIERLELGKVTLVRIAGPVPS